MYIFVILFSLMSFLWSSEEKNDLHEKIFNESEYVAINGVQYHYRRFTHTSPEKSGNVLFIHGFSGSTFSWRKNYDSFAKAGFDIVSVDLPGFGYSSRKKNKNHSSSALALTLWSLMIYVDTGKWNIIGHSMGASVAGAMAAMMPDRTEKLILEDGIFSGTCTNKRNGFGMRLVATKPVKGIFEIIGKKYFFNFKKFKSLLSSAYGCEADSVAVNGYLAPFKIKKTVSAILDLGKSKETVTLKPEDIRCDILLIWGKKDTWIPLKTADKFIEKCPNARLEVIEGAGHCSMETHSNEFNAKAIGFLKKKPV